MQEAGLQVIEVSPGSKCNGSNLAAVIGEAMHSCNLKRCSAKQQSSLRAAKDQVSSFLPCCCAVQNCKVHLEKQNVSQRQLSCSP